MKHRLRSLIFVTLTLLIVPQVAAAEAPTVRETAEDQRRHALNFNLLVPYGYQYDLTFQAGLNGNYSFLVTPHHGVVIETGATWLFAGEEDALVWNSSLGYRWHWQGGQDSWFMGITGSYRRESGDIDRSRDEMPDVGSINVDAISITSGVGKRWVWDSGLNLTFRVGVGLGYYSVTAKDDEASNVAFAEEVQDDYDSLPIAYDGEFSVGYSF